MKVRSIEGNRQRLDGGAMFGHAPKALWEKWLTPDSNNQIELACRCLFIETRDRKILLETGVGAFFEPELAKRYGVQSGGHHLIQNLEKLGLSHHDITDVVLSHLHFDHAGGLLPAFGEEGGLLFPNARYIVGKEAWLRACTPHPRDKASFIPKMIEQLNLSQRLHLVESEGLLHEDLPEFSCFFTDGHTPGQMHTVVQGDSQTLVFTGDLIPGSAWIHAPITMGYDRYPEKVIDEKNELYKNAVPKNWWLFFTHDPNHSHCKVSQNEKGKYYGTDLKNNWNEQNF